MLVVMDDETTLLISGTGDVVEPDEGVIAIGSGGSYALAAARALKPLEEGGIGHEEFTLDFARHGWISGFGLDLGRL